MGQWDDAMLVMVVGPSGAGKDTVLNRARQALASDPRFRFVRRTITRPADPDGEAHEAVTEAEFAMRSFALQWQAHGLRYGIPDDIVHDLARGTVVVANVSRGIVALAAQRFPARIIEVTAPPALLAQRLAARGREPAADVRNRLTRSATLPTDVPLDQVVNDRTPAEAATVFTSLLIRVALSVQPA